MAYTSIDNESISFLCPACKKERSGSGGGMIHFSSSRGGPEGQLFGECSKCKKRFSCMLTLTDVREL